MMSERAGAPSAGLGEWAARTGTRIADAHPTYALKVALITVLSLYVAFLLDLDHTFWALLTVPLIVRPDGGTTVWRAMARLAGTLLGCLSGFALAVLFGQTGETAIIAVAIFIFLVAFWGQKESGLDVYTYGTAGLVTLIIVVDTGPDAANAFSLAVERTTETTIPVIVAFAVMLVVFPRSVSAQAADGLRAARTAALSLTGRILRNEAGGGLGYEPNVLPSLSLANTALRGLAYERTRRNHLRPRMTAVAMALNKLAIRAETGRFALFVLPDEASDADIRAARLRLADAIDALPAPGAPPAEKLAAADRMAGVAETVHPRQVLPLEGSDLSDHALKLGAAFYRMRLLALAVEELMRTEAALSDTSLPVERMAPMAGRHFDPLGAAEVALRPMLVFLALSTVWLATAWPNGQVLALIGTAVTLIFPTIAPRAVRISGARSLGGGIACGGVFAMVLMVLLPNLEGFVALALVLGGAVFAIFLVAKAPQHLAFAIGSIMVISVGFQPQNTPVFDPLTLVNVLLTLIFLPIALIAALTIIFPEDAGWVRRHLRRSTDDLLRRAAAGRIGPFAMVEQFVDVLADLGLSVAPDDRKGLHLRVRARAALIAGGEFQQQFLIERAGHLPPQLAAFGPRLRATVLAAAAHADGPVDCTIVQELRAMLRETFAAGGLDEEARVESLRYVAIGELLAAIIKTGQLSRGRGVSRAS